MWDEVLGEDGDCVEDSPLGLGLGLGLGLDHDSGFGPFSYFAHAMAKED